MKIATKLKKAANNTAWWGRMHTGRDHGGDGIGRVVQPVHEVERERQHHQEYQHPESNVHLQVFSSEMPSARFATSRQRSVTASSSS